MSNNIPFEEFLNILKITPNTPKIKELKKEISILDEKISSLSKEMLKIEIKPSITTKQAKEFVKDDEELQELHKNGNLRNYYKLLKQKASVYAQKYNTLTPLETDDFWKFDKELELLEMNEVEISFRVSKGYPMYYIKILEKGYEVKCASGDDTHIETNTKDLWDYVAYDYLEEQEESKFQNNKKTRKRI